MKTFLIASTLIFLSLSRADTKDVEHELLLIVGAPGEERFVNGFESAANAWGKAAASTNASIKVVGLEETEKQDRTLIEEWVTNLTNDTTIPAWIVYIGHGTHTQKNTLLNLRGPDLSAATLGEWLDPLERTLIFVHGGSASAPFINRLSKPNRILMTATRSGTELNYARFGESFARVISSREGDSNQDGQVSLLEAFVSAAQSVEQFYEDEGRLASEHALIDDNGDSVGTPADWFRGERLVKQPEGDTSPDGFRSRQIAFIASEQERLLTPDQRFARDRLEAELETLRVNKKDLDENEYYDALEKILLELGEIYLHDKNES